MSSFQVGRVSSQSISTNLLRYVGNTQQDLAKVQEEISSGKKITRPSDGSASISAILKLRESLAAREQAELNMDSSLAVLNNTDQALSDTNDILLEARDVLLGQIGVTSDPEQRETMAQTIDGNLQSLIQIANRQYSGMSLFGGNNGASPEGLVFEEFLGGVRYVGGDVNLEADVNTLHTQEFTSNGLEAFGALSARVKTQADWQPLAVATTKLADLDGATNSGIQKGDVTVSIDGTVVTVDLSDADTMGDVATRINDAITGVDPTAGALSIAGAGGGFDLTANVGHTITIDDTLNGATAETLGLGLTATAATANGTDLGVRLSLTTDLSDLGATIDWASGLELTQGAVTKTADLSAASTVQDVINAVESLNLGIRVEINAAGRGLDFISEVSGLELGIGENGGTTATDLGIRTMDTITKLSDFRGGLGVEIDPDNPDLRVNLHDGTSFDVDLAGATTLDDVITAIGAAATTAGLTVGADITIGLATTGNGLAIDDGTAGGADFTIQALGSSQAAHHLNLAQNAGTGTQIDTGDQSKIRVESVFTHLQEVSSFLSTNNQVGMTIAGERLEEDLKTLTHSRAAVGIQAQRIEQQMQRSSDLALTEQTLLSSLQDTDLTEAITRFTQLQQQLQASLQTGATQFELSLLNFI